MPKLPNKRDIATDAEAIAKASIPLGRDLLDLATGGVSEKAVKFVRNLDKFDEQVRAEKLEILFRRLIDDELPEEEFREFLERNNFNRHDTLNLMKRAIETSSTATHLVLMTRAIRAFVKGEITADVAAEYMKLIADLRRDQIISLSLFHGATHRAIVGSREQDGPEQAVRERLPRPTSCLGIYGVGEVAQEIFKASLEDVRTKYSDIHFGSIQADWSNLLATNLVRTRKAKFASPYKYKFTKYGWNLCEHLRFFTLDLSEITQSKDR